MMNQLNNDKPMTIAVALEIKMTKDHRILESGPQVIVEKNGALAFADSLSSPPTYTDFDDSMANALRALVGVSANTQVIVLTHHKHLLEIARMLAAETVHVCELAA